MFGPPGTGKTLMTRALANEVGAKIYTLSGPEIYSKWYGESEKGLRDLFEEAKQNAPSLIVIDELDALAPRRDKVSGETEHRISPSLLTLIDGLARLKGVVVVGTTNRLDSIDMALRREGRLGLEIHVGAPMRPGGGRSWKYTHVRCPFLPTSISVSLRRRRWVSWEPT